MCSSGYNEVELSGEVRQVMERARELRLSLDLNGLTAAALSNLLGGLQLDLRELADCLGVVSVELAKFPNAFEHLGNRVDNLKERIDAAKSVDDD